MSENETPETEATAPEPETAIGTQYAPPPDRLPLVEEGEGYQPSATREN